MERKVRENAALMGDQGFCGSYGDNQMSVIRIRWICEDEYIRREEEFLRGLEVLIPE